mmetsp:Transcript_34164/g.78883  ORF Transcript_34164/g.78883 Transcript_34164/m.78883 type:complete len:115 (-) Transcript_34164:138-482(-)
MTLEPEHLIPPKGYKTTFPIQEAIDEASKKLSWDDNFFVGDEDVIAVFDYDYALIEEFDTSVRWLSCCLSFIFPPAAACSLICLEPCFLKKRVQWDVYSKHLCITRGKGVVLWI